MRSCIINILLLCLLLSTAISQIHYNVSRVEVIPNVPVKFINDKTIVYNDDINGNYKALKRTFETIGSNIQIEFIIRGQGLDINTIILRTPERQLNKHFKLLMEHFYDEFFFTPKFIKSWSNGKLDSLEIVGYGYASIYHNKLNVRMSKLEDGLTWSISSPIMGRTR